MTKTKIRIYLMAMIVIAVIVGVFYYTNYIKKDTVITEGTLVENSMEEQSGRRDCIHQNRT